MRDTDLAYTVMLKICCAGIVIDSLERLTRARQYTDTGSYSWVILRQRWAHLPARFRRVADSLCRGAGRLAFVLALRIAATGLLFVTPLGSLWFSVALTVLLGAQMYTGFRTAGLGTAGSDLMTLAILGSAWLTTVVAKTPLTLRAGLWFMAAQSCLAYSIAGITKLNAPLWRSGRALVAVLSTYCYGNRRLHTWLAPRPRLCVLLCWAMMLWEATFPIVLFVPEGLRFPLLGIGVLFHASLAAVMGLNLFLFAFPATYAAIWAVGR